MNIFQRRAMQNRVAGLQLIGALGMMPGPGMQAQGPAGGSLLAHPLVQAALAQAAAQPAMPLLGQNPGSQGTYAVQTYPDRTNRFPFPMPSTSMGATSAGVSTANAQVPTKPVRLIMSESTGPSSLTDITIATTPQFASLTGNFPIAAFANNATDSVVNFDTAQTGQAITLSLFNSGAGATVVLSGFFADIAI